MIMLWVALGAAIGAPVRYLVDGAVSRRCGERFPVGTLVVNVTGSFVLGIVAGQDLAGEAFALLGTGFCGAFTTYSAFGYETLRLASLRRLWPAAVNVAANVIGCVAALTAGWLAGSAL